MKIHKGKKLKRIQKISDLSKEKEDLLNRDFQVMKSLKMDNYGVITRRN